MAAVGESVLKAQMDAWAHRTVSLALGMAGGGMARAEQSGIERIAEKLTERFGAETKVFTRSSGAIQREWTNVQTGVRHILAGPETHEVIRGSGPVTHYNYEVHPPSVEAGGLKSVGVHLDVHGNPIQ